MTRMVTAVAVALPIAAVLWFEIVYLWFGLTGGDAAPPVTGAIGLLSLAVTSGWSLRGTLGAAEAALRGSRLGIAVAMTLPVVALAVMLLWHAAEARRDLGMGGLMLYSMPVVAFIVSIILIAIFATVRWLAGRSIAGGASHQS